MRASVQKVKWKIIKWYLGLLSLYISKRKYTEFRPFDILIIDAVMDRVIHKPRLLNVFSSLEQESYIACLQETAFWHGTGKLQYKNKFPIDVFASTLNDRYLRPAIDIFDPRMGEMTSLSLTRQRMYARIYADMHTYGGVRPNDRYGTPRFWAYYFIMASVLTVAKEMKVRHPYAYLKELSKWRKVVQQKWSVKVHKNPKASAGEFFTIGSDICNNYPILIGIKDDGMYDWLTTGQGVELYEIRLNQSVDVTNFTHLEVPANKVLAMRNELKQHNYNIPVFSLECCEQYASHLRFSQLVAGSR